MNEEPTRSAFLRLAELVFTTPKIPPSKSKESEKEASQTLEPHRPDG